MQKWVLLLWLMLPLVVGFYHAGPGQERALLDRISTALSQAEEDAANEDWSAAEARYEEALSLLPADRVEESRRIRLELAKAQMLVKKLPVAHGDLKVLVDELKADPSADHQLVAEARAALANSQYYMTWLMRLEGEPKERWEPEIESARQTFRWLAEEAKGAGHRVAAKKHAEDLEATIRLARMDLSDLEGLPLPSQ